MACREVNPCSKRAHGGPERRWRTPVRHRKLRLGPGPGGSMPVQLPREFRAQERVVTQTHADVTRDVVATLEAPSRGYVLLLLGAVGLFLVGALTFLILLKD